MLAPKAETCSYNVNNNYIHLCWTVLCTDTDISMKQTVCTQHFIMDLNIIICYVQSNCFIELSVMTRQRRNTLQSIIYYFLLPYSFKCITTRCII